MSLNPYQLMWIVGVLATAVGAAIYAFLRARHHGDAVTRRIVESLRQQSPGTEARLSNLKVAEIAKVLRDEQDVRRSVHEQDYFLLRQTLRNQFVLSLVIYLLAGSFVFALVWAVLVRTERPARCPVTNLRLVSNLDEAEGHAVDTDDLALSWKAVSSSEEAEVWLENVQTRATSQSLRTSTGKEQIFFQKKSYRNLLGVRERNGINRLRAVMKTSSGTFPSEEFDLYVGITILIHTDSKNYLDVTALIDDSSEQLKQYAFKGGIVTWESGKADTKNGGVGFLIEEGWFKNPSARVHLTNELSVEQWQRLGFAYYEPDPGWLIRQMKRLPLDLTKDKLIK